MLELIDIKEMKKIAIDKYFMSADDFDALINYLL